MKITANHLTHYYGSECVLDDVTLDLEAGKFVAIIGESGSGKTTLLSILSTLLNPTRGEVFFDDKTIVQWGSVDEFRCKNIGFVFQFHYLISYLTLRENIALGALDSKRIDSLMGDLGIEKLSRRYADEVSGGQRQRAAIARALVNAPSVVFADEPTGNLDTNNAIMVYELFKRFTSQGTGFVVASHDKKIRDYADIIIEMEDGKIVKILKR